MNTTARAASPPPVTHAYLFIGGPKDGRFLPLYSPLPTVRMAPDPFDIARQVIEPDDSDCLYYRHELTTEHETQTLYAHQATIRPEMILITLLHGYQGSAANDG